MKTIVPAVIAAAVIGLGVIGVAHAQGTPGGEPYQPRLAAPELQAQNEQYEQNEANEQNEQHEQNERAEGPEGPETGNDADG